MRIKLTTYTDPEGQKHCITSFGFSGAMSHRWTMRTPITL